MNLRFNTTIGEVLEGLGGSLKTGPFGTTLKASEYAEIGGVPVVSVGEEGMGSLRIGPATPRVGEEVLRRLPEYVLQKGDIVFGRKGAVDRCALVRENESGYFLGSDGIRLRLPPVSILNILHPSCSQRRSVIGSGPIRWAPLRHP